MKHHANADTAVLTAYYIDLFIDIHYDELNRIHTDTETEKSALWVRTEMKERKKQ